MELSNQTLVNEFILLGFSNIPYLQALYFLAFLIMYIVTLSGNILLIVVVRMNTQLQTPMYFFLSNLSAIDIIISTTIVPKILVNTVVIDRSISFVGCALQMYFSLVMGVTECLLLAVMAFDRYAAICKPLHYNTVMNKKLTMCLAGGSWTVSFMNAFIHVFLIFQLPFCRSHNIKHYFCEMPPFFKLSCRNPWFNQILMYIAACIVALCSFCLTIISYIRIISTILTIQSSQGRYKAFSTCGSPLTVVSIYYCTIMFMYMRPHSNASSETETDKTVPLLYTTITPMLNPIIYSIRNKDVKHTLKKIKTL
ncbi:olfactory receptor 13C9-like [Discoglossus pictus]